MRRLSDRTDSTAELKEHNSNKEALKPSGRLDMSNSLTLLTMAFAVGLVLQHIFEIQRLGPERAGQAFVGVGVVAFLMTIAAGLKQKWRKLLTSNRFSVPLLIVVTFISVLGTLILQKKPPAILNDTYGSATNFIRGLFLDDVFHSFGFSILLGIGAGGIVLVTLRKRKLTAKYLGALGAHIGLLLILLGAAVGNISAIKGSLKMHTGQSSDRFVVSSPNGQVEEHPLGFSIRLDKFSLLHYEPEFRLMVYDVSEEKEERLANLDPAADDSRAELKEYGADLIDYWPNYVVKPHVSPLKAKPDVNAKSIAALGLTKGDPGETIQWVFDEGGPDGGRFKIDNHNLVFFWNNERAAAFLEAIDGTGDSPHVIVASGEHMNVEVGQKYSIPNTDYQFEVLRAFKNFSMDSQTRKARDRSTSPDNPAIEVAIRDSSGNPMGNTWLFAKFPDFKHQGADSKVSALTYKYTGSEIVGNNSAIAVGEVGQLWFLKKGKVQTKSTLKEGTTLQLGAETLKVHALHQAVERLFEETNASDRADNPMAKIWVSGEKEPRLIRPRQPVQLLGKNVLVLGPKGDNVRDYVSTISVLESDKVVMTKKVEVNYPLEYKGFVFFQNDYRPDDPTFSGFQVVKDPGLRIVYLGFLANVCGVFCVIFLPPLLRKRKKLSASKRGGP